MCPQPGFQYIHSHNSQLLTAPLAFHLVVVNMSFNTPWFNQQDPSFFNSLNKSKTVHVILCADSEDFAEEVVQQWLAEGFNVIYVPFGKGGKDFVGRVQRAGENVGVGEQYAVVGTSHQLPRP